MSKTSILVAAAVLVSTLGIATTLAFVPRAPFVNNPPSAAGDSYTLHGNGNIGSILANDSDPDPGNTIFPVQVTAPTNGSLTYFGSGNFYYSRNLSTWYGVDSFTYKACDNQIPSLCSSVVKVTLVQGHIAQ